MADCLWKPELLSFEGNVALNWKHFAQEVEIFIAAAYGEGVDEYQVPQSIPVEYVCAHKGPREVWNWVNEASSMLLAAPTFHSPMVSWRMQTSQEPAWEMYEGWFRPLAWPS